MIFCHILPRMNQRLDIDLLRTLKAVHDDGGVTRAAGQLALTQSAVSHKIRRFEKNLGCRLLRREPGHELLTQDGKQLVLFAEKIISMHDEALSAINKPQLSGRLRLGITEELVSSGLAVVLGRYQRLYPEVQVSTQVEQSLQLDRLLTDGKIDMAVMQVFVDDIQPTDHVLYRQALRWVASDSYQDQPEQPLAFIAFDELCFYRQWAEKIMSALNRPVDVVLQCASNEGVRNAVAAGMGVALLGEKHWQDGFRVMPLPEPPAIAFVIRVQPALEAEHIRVLFDDIRATLGQ